MSRVNVYARSVLPRAARRELAIKYGCEPGTTVVAQCYWCDEEGHIRWPLLDSGAPSSWPIFDHHIDHLLPLCRGGSHLVGNLVLACAWCNCSRSARTESEYVERRLG